jgi:hypothetical protein
MSSTSSSSSSSSSNSTRPNAALLAATTCRQQKMLLTACQKKKFSWSALSEFVTQVKSPQEYTDTCLDLFMDYRKCYETSMDASLGITSKPVTVVNSITAQEQDVNNRSAPQ